MKKINAALTLFGLTLAACAEPGPAERAGETLDDAVDSVMNAARDVRDEAEDFAVELSENIDGDR